MRVGPNAQEARIDRKSSATRFARACRASPTSTASREAHFCRQWAARVSLKPLQDVSEVPWGVSWASLGLRLDDPGIPVDAPEMPLGSAWAFQRCSECSGDRFGNDFRCPEPCHEALKMIPEDQLTASCRSHLAAAVQQKRPRKILQRKLKKKLKNFIDCCQPRHALLHRFLQDIMLMDINGHPCSPESGSFRSENF